ncbi:MAG: hypothetical protein FD153_471 [Rhodospirillaceae bacterium]|nr:MAG: hypothetical protein FD153_471 [Rhodospirillaceae bacterium]
MTPAQNVRRGGAPRMAAQAKRCGRLAEVTIKAQEYNKTYARWSTAPAGGAAFPLHPRACHRKNQRWERRLILHATLCDLRIEIARPVAPGYFGERKRLDFCYPADTTECLVAVFADTLHGLHGRLVEGAWIEFGLLFGGNLAPGSGHCHTTVGVDVDLAHTMPDPFDNFLDRHTEGLRHGTTMLVDQVLQLLRY